jgi:hypothetical protein
VEVVADLGAGRYRVQIGGRERLVRAESALVPGSIVTGRIVTGRLPASPPVPGALPGRGTSLAEPLLEIKPLATVALPAAERQASLLASLGLPVDAISKALLRASLVEGLRPEAARLARMRRAVAAAGEGGLEDRAAFAARLEAKGLGSSDGALDCLTALAQGGTGRGEGQEEGQEEDQGRGGGRAEFGYDESLDVGKRGTETRGGPTDPAFSATSHAPADEAERVFESEQALVAGLAGLLEGLLSRSAPDAGLLGLYNHTRTKEGEVLVPFRFDLGEIAFKGGFRLHLSGMRGGSVRLEGRFTATRRDSPAGDLDSWGFVLASRGGGASSLRLSPPPAMLRRDWTPLVGSLALSGCSLEVGGGAPEPESSVEVDLDV